MIGVTTERQQNFVVVVAHILCIGVTIFAAVGSLTGW